VFRYVPLFEGNAAAKVSIALTAIFFWSAAFVYFSTMRSVV